MENVWSQALRVIKERVNKQVFDTWFYPTRLVSANDELVVIEVPSPIFRDLFQEKYQFMIEEVLFDLLNKELKITFVINATKSETSPGEEIRAYEVSKTAQKDERRNGRYGIQQLNMKYTFNNFVVGSCNQFAHAAAIAVAQYPAKAYNPLFLYGGVGLGKTHLMHAIGHLAASSNSAMNLLYLSSETFTNEVITGIREDKMQEFRRKFREIDILLIDDIQFIAGKESTETEFFHTFNALYENHKQIVISSDAFPKDISNIEERLRSRFEWGLIADIQPPSLETKIAILQKKAMVEGIDLPDDVALFIAQRIKSNIRELEGSLIRLAAYASMIKTAISLDFAKQVLKDLLPHEKPQVDIEFIQKEVAKYFNIKVANLRSKSREQKIARPRQIAMYLCRENTDRSLPEIGEKFGGKDHSTVIYACKKVEADLVKDPILRKTISYFTDIIKT